jgi:hypothetical protein
MPIEIAERRRIGVAFVKSLHRVGRIGGRWCSHLFPSHVLLLPPLNADQRPYHQF